MDKEMLQCKLTGAELTQYSVRCAGLVQEIEQAQDARKAAGKSAQANIDAMLAELSKLSGYIREKAEPRWVPTEVRKDFPEGRVAIIRLDTNELVRERAMTFEERQLEMKLDSEKGAVPLDELEAAAALTEVGKRAEDVVVGFDEGHEEMPEEPLDPPPDPKKGGEFLDRVKKGRP